MKNFYLLLIAFVFFTGCKTASKSYLKGDYKDAIELSIKKLQKDPYDASAAEVLKEAYSAAINQHENAIRNISDTRSEDKYEAILSRYLQLQNLYDLILQSPVAAKVVNPKNYIEFIDTYRDKTISYYVANAEKWQAQGTKEAYRHAYQEYRKALRYKPNDIALKSQRDEMYNAALTKVLVVPMQQQYGGYGNYGYSNSYQFQNFQNDVMRTLSYNMGSDFVKFFSELELRSKNVEPDQIMELNLGRIMLGRPYDDRNSREVSKRVVVKETVYKPDSVVKEYATVRAHITTTRRTVVSEGDLYIMLRDVKGRTIWSDRFTGQHRWQTEFATYSGDERALSDNDKRLLNQRDDRQLSEEEIMEHLFREINSQLTYRLRNFYARY